MLRRLRSTSILLILFTTFLTVACASTGRHWSGLVQGPTSGRQGAVTPGNLERVEALPPGAPLVVTLTTGTRVEGAFKTIAPSVLTLTDRSGKEFNISLSQVDRIVAPGTRDRLTNGAAIGAGIGLGAALAILAAIGSQDGYVLPSAKVGAPVLFTGVGGLVGALVDRAHTRDQVLYRGR